MTEVVDSAARVTPPEQSETPVTPPAPLMPEQTSPTAKVEASAIATVQSPPPKTEPTTLVWIPAQNADSTSSAPAAVQTSNADALSNSAPADRPSPNEQSPAHTSSANTTAFVPSEPSPTQSPTTPTKASAPDYTPAPDHPSSAPTPPAPTSDSYPAQPQTELQPEPQSQPDAPGAQQSPVQKAPPSPHIPVPRKTPPHRSNNRKPASNPRPSQPDRPLPKNLPKVARNRPENARVFIGNLASEYTDVTEIVSVFYKYGQLIEEPVLRRSFGFVQYSTAEAANLAVAAEQGRIIGGIAIDLSIADNREVKRGTHVANNTPFSHNAKAQYKRGREREREPNPPGGGPGARKRRRSLSPASAARKGGVHPPQYRRQRPEPKGGVYLRILCMSPTAKGYARHCENTFRTMTNLKADVLNIVAAGLGEALGRAMRDVIPYVMVVASKDVEDGTCTIRTLEKTGYEKSGRGNGVIPLREAVEVCLIERGVIAPQGMNQQGPHQPPGSMPHMPMPMNQNPRHMPGQMMNGAQWMSQGPSAPHGAMPSPGMDGSKPGWMNGPRAPHPSNPRIAGPGMQQAMPPMPGMVNSGPPPYGYSGMDGGRPPYGQPPRPDQEYDRPGPPAGYEGGPAMPPPPPPHNMGPDYMRNAPPGSYPPNMSTNAGYSDRYGPQGGSARPNSYGGMPDGRESEYDPAAVMPSSRGQSGGYGNNWNRENRPYGNGQSGQGGGRDRDSNYQQMGSNAQSFPSNGLSGDQYGQDRQPGYQNMNQGAQPAGYDGRNATYPGNQYPQYPPPPPPYGRPDGGNPAPPMSGGDNGARYGDAYNGDNNQRYPNHSNSMYNPGRDARQGQWSGNDNAPRPGGNSARPPSNAAVMYGALPSQPSGSYQPRPDSSGGHSYSPRNDRPAAQAPASSATAQGSGPGVDFGKLTNLISAFKQQQQQQQQQQPQQQQPPQQAAQQQSQRGRTDAAVAGSSGGMSHILAVPGVQQALQNIGGGRGVAAEGGVYGAGVPQHQAHAQHQSGMQHQPHPQGYQQSRMPPQNYYR